MRALWPLLLIAAATPALAQAPAGTSDPAALQRALERINGRLDQLEKENKRLKAQPPAAGTAAAPAQVPAPGSAGPKAPPQAVPGWFVYLVPFLEDSSGVPVGGFAGPMSEFNFDMHSRTLPGQNRFAYHGKSYFKVDEDANYTFSIMLEPVAAAYTGNAYNVVSFNCAAELRVNDKIIVEGMTKFEELQPPLEKERYRSQTFFGQTRLIPETDKGFAVTFKADCWPTEQKNVTYYDEYLSVWKKNRFKIMVKTPKDAAPRAFLPHELYYVGQP